MPELQLKSCSAPTQCKKRYRSLPGPYGSYDSQGLCSVQNTCLAESIPNRHLQCQGATHPKPSRSLFELAHRLYRPSVKAILLDDLPVMEHVELLRGVLARKEHDGLLAARVVGQEVCHIEDLLAYDAPAIRLSAVLRDLLLGHRHGTAPC